MNVSSKTLELKNVTREQREDGAWLKGRIKCSGTELDGVELWFSYPPEYYPYLSQTAHPWVAALLMPAMRFGRTLKIDLPVSSKLQENAQKFMEIMHVWRKEYRVVSVEGKGSPANQWRATSVGCFFSVQLPKRWLIFQAAKACFTFNAKYSES